MLKGLGVLLGLALSLTPAGAPTFDYASAEHELTVLTNSDRTSNGLASLRPREDVGDVARERSQDMAERNYFSHEIPGGGYFEDLLDAYGIGYRMAGENIARNNHLDHVSVGRAQSGFLNSPAHRANIMEPGYREMGAGAWSRGPMKYYTVLFLHP